MALLGLLKKQKKEEIELPPPPKAESFESVSEIPDIRVDEELPLPPSAPQETEETMPEFPQFPSEDEQVPAPTTKAELPEQIHLPQKTEETVVFDKTIHPAEEKRVEVIHRTVPVHKTFVSVDDYTAITDSCEIVRSKLSDAESLVRRLNELKAEENKTIENWLDYLEEVERKLAHVDKILAKAQS